MATAHSTVILFSADIIVFVQLFFVSFLEKSPGRNSLRKQTCVVIFHCSFNETNSKTNSCYIYIAAIKQKW